MFNQRKQGSKIEAVSYAELRGKLTLLKTDKSLTTLDLGDVFNAYPDHKEEIRNLILQIIQNNRYLHSLSLQHNLFTLEEASMLAAAFKKRLKFFTVLDFGCAASGKQNLGGMVGVIAILNTQIDNRNLQMLNFIGCIDPEAMQQDKNSIVQLIRLLKKPNLNNKVYFSADVRNQLESYMSEERNEFKRIISSKVLLPSVSSYASNLYRNTRLLPVDEKSRQLLESKKMIS